MPIPVFGTLPQIVRNDAKLYEGNLRHYYRLMWHHGGNLQNPYHNFGHVFNVFWLCYQACRFYQRELSPRQMRNLLLAAMFHDFDHPGVKGEDDLNLERAIRGLRRHILPEDLSHTEDIVLLMKFTEYPHKVDIQNLPLPGQILRDADMAQSLNPVWIQQVIFGLAKEWSMAPIQVLALQLNFTRGIKFHTDWAQQMFPTSQIEAKIREIEEHNELVRPNDD